MKFSQSIVWCNSLCWKTYSQEIFTNLIFKQPQCRAFIVNMQSLPPMSLQSHRTSWKAHLSFPFVIFECEERKINQQRLSFLEFRRKDEVFSISLWRFGGLALLNQGGWAWGKFWIKSGDGLIDGKTGRYFEYIIMKKYRTNKILIFSKRCLLISFYPHNTDMRPGSEPHLTDQNQVRWHA